MRGFRQDYPNLRLTHLSTIIFLTVVSCVLTLSSCSTKKNTPASRQWQAFNTRYNVYFNGSEHYKETLADLERNYEDDYSRQVLMHPIEAKEQPKLPQPSGDFTRTIEKMQKAIQLHSISKKPARRNSSAKEKAFRAREEFNPFLHNAWLMMGRGQYYNGDFLGAASTFLYISKHFSWLPSVVTEARLWQARSYCALNWLYEAENILHLVKENDLTDKNLRFLFNFVEADYLIRNERLEEAIPFLIKAAQGSVGSQKTRLWFLLGQLYSNLGQRENAYKAFKKAEGGPATPYRTKFNARIKQSEVFSGSDIRKQVNSLKSLTRYARNKEFLDQIYYAIGNLYLSRRDTTHAIENYILAVKKSERQGIDMALAQLALGNIYFSQRKYVEAQPCYSEAIPFLSESYPDYKLLRKRSDVLDELAIYAGNVILQDSLIALSKLSPEEQEKVAKKLVDELILQEKLAKEEAEREEFLANQPQNDLMNANSAAIPGFQANSDNSWYFYNTFTKNAGKTQFQRKWGSRRLEDDWRRRNKTTFSFDEPENEESEDEEALDMVAASDSVAQPDADLLKRESDPHFVEYYLKQIPKTPEDIEVAEDVIQEGLFNMGLILKDKLEDFTAAKFEFLRLQERFPENVYSLDVYYNLYLMAARRDDMAAAEEWRKIILERFPDSTYGLAMRDPNYFEHLRQMNQIQESMYEKAYSAYLDNENSTVHSLTEEMQQKYPLSPLMPKFVFIDGLAYFTEGQNDIFKDKLTELLQKWPDTDMTDMASGILRGLKEGRTLQSDGMNSRGMIWQIRLSDSQEEQLAEDGLPANFERDPDAPQYLVLAFPRDSINPNTVLYQVARFNFSSFIVKDFDLEQMSFSNIGLLIIKGFANLRELEHYRTVMENSDLNLPSEVMPIMISKSNFELLLREGRTFEEYFRFREEDTAAQVEADVLDEMDIPVSEEDASPSEEADSSPSDDSVSSDTEEESSTLSDDSGSSDSEGADSSISEDEHISSPEESE
ncbi:MAG: tetratricopeptide repeat protein [Muribaculaceae bacterium]|nr:tetratricopeptide repeat protein [Muribaculaceae bacterium]